MRKEELKQIIKDNALFIKSEDDNFFFTPNDGVWIFDFRVAFLQGMLLDKFSSFFWDKYEKDFPFQVGGLELGAIPFISGIVMEGMKRGKEVNSFFVRKYRKESGVGNKIEGKLNDEKVIIVDDLLNSAKSIEKVAVSVLDENKEIFKVFTFVNFGNANAKDILSKYKLDYDFEFTLSDFGLDIFGNTLDIKKENSKLPIIYPENLNLYNLANPNKYISAPKSSPLYEGNSIYFGGEGGKMISINSDTGTLNWDFTVDKVKGHKNILSSPILIDNSLVFGSYDGNLYNLNKESGKINWVFSDGDWIGSSPCYSEKNNMVYIGLELGGINTKGAIVGVDFSSGEKKWEAFFDDYVHCSPGFSGKINKVICGSNDGKILILDGRNGNIDFSIEIGEPIKGGFDFSNNGENAIFGAFDNNIYSINLLTGKVNWKKETNNIIYSFPLVIDDNIFVGSLDKFFYHLDDKGNIINKVRTFGKIFSKPIYLENNIIAFGSNDSYIYFYDYKQKKVIFVIEHKERISTNLAYDSRFKHIYVSDFLNKLYKYSLNGYLN